MAEPERHETSLRHDMILVGVVSAPFFLNDFLFLLTDTALGWLAADYFSKLLALGLLFALSPVRRTLFGAFTLQRPVLETVLLVGMATVLIIGVDTFLRSVVSIEVEALVLFKYPKVESPVLYWTDVTFGLLLTAVSEELIFRVVFTQLLARRFAGEGAFLASSAAFFALIHWSHGVTSLVVAFVAGLVLMALYRRAGSVLPAMVAHYLVNLWDFV